VINHPMYATGVGLVVRGSNDYSDFKMDRSERKILRGLKTRIKKWFNDFF